MMHQTRHSFPTEDAVAALYERHSRNILTYIRMRLPSEEDAEDLLVEVFLVAMQSNSLTRMQTHEQLTWLRHVAHNKIVDRYRRQGRRPAHLSLDEAAELLYDDEYVPETLTLLNEDKASLRVHLATLPPLQQEVLRLRFGLDLSTREIALRLAKTDNAIRMLLSRTLSRLRALYEKGGR
jgi:RNA polymerase sigma factor (sigma-70 family)